MTAPLTHSPEVSDALAAGRWPRFTPHGPALARLH